MSFIRYIDRLRARPERERRTIHLGATIGLMSLILGVWVLSRAALLESSQVFAGDGAPDSPISSITASVRSAFSAISEETHAVIDGVVQLRDEKF